MAVKTFCSMCDTEIASVVGDALKNLTGSEICSFCREHLKKTRAGMEEEKDNFLKKIEEYKISISKVYKTAMAEFEKSITKCHSLYSTRQAEIDNRLKKLMG